MSEEQVNTEQNENTQPAMNLDSTIQVDGEEVSVKDLLNARDEASRLREYNDHAKTLISPAGSDNETRETAVRYLMTQEGYSPADIEEYIQFTNNPPAVEPEPQPQMQEPQIPEPQGMNEMDEIDRQQQLYEARQEQLMREQEQQRMANIEDRQQRLGAEMMKKELNSALDKTMNSHESIAKLMGLESGGDYRKEVLRHEVEASMLDSLRRRRTAGENFNPSWFAEEAGKAAKSVYDKFSSVIGDPDKIQRAPETATENDSLFNKPPVDPPKYEKGDDMGAINTKARDWTLDTLLRSANDGATGGESKA